MIHLSRTASIASALLLADFLLPRNKGVEALNVMCRRLCIAEKKELFNDDIDKSLMNEIVNYLFVQILTGLHLTSWLNYHNETFTKTFSFLEEREVEQN